MNSVNVQSGDRGNQIDSNGQKSRALALTSSYEADKPSLCHKVSPRLPGCMSLPLTPQLIIPVLIPWCTEVSMSFDYESLAYIVSRKGKLIEIAYKKDSSLCTTKILHSYTCLWRNYREINFFHCRQVPFDTSAWNLDPRNCIFFRYRKLLFRTSFRSRQVLSYHDQSVNDICESDRCPFREPN
jgi:hypothetical protein